MKYKTELQVLAPNGPVVMAVVLDLKTNTERVVVGEKGEVYRLLNGKETNKVSFDQERPLGQTIFDYEAQNRGDWSAEVIMPLGDALRSAFGRGDYENQAKSFLKDQLNSENAVSVYTGFSILSYYSAGMTRFGDIMCSNLMTGKMQNVVRNYMGDILKTDDGYSMESGLLKIKRLDQSSLFLKEDGVEHWNIGKLKEKKCMVTEGNILPLVEAYLKWLLENNNRILTCDVCGKVCIKPSGHYSFCSDACRATKKRQNEMDYDERAKMNRYDNMYQARRDAMRKRINRFKVQENVSIMQIKEAESFYEKFRDEAKKMKKIIKTEDELKAFQDWLFQKERGFDELCKN